MPLLAGEWLLDRYRILGILGQGGFGAVYRATDEHLGLDCAIKENLSPSAAAEHQFRREARLLATLRHPNLPRVTNHFVSHGQQYLVMDFVEGEDLEQHLRQQGELPQADVLRWGEQICAAVEYLHSQTPPVIHRDIKPANIKITSTGQAMLVDFGIAKAWAAGQSTATGARGVTPGFAPPEQYDLGQTDQASDQYALGATLYNLLTGHRPPDSVERLLGRAWLVPPGNLRPGLPPQVGGAILRAMELTQAGRFASVAAFAQALADESYRYPSEAPVPQPSGGELPTLRPPRGRSMLRRLAVGLALLGMAVALVAVVVGPAELLAAARALLAPPLAEPTQAPAPAAVVQLRPTQVTATNRPATALPTVEQPSPTPTPALVAITAQNAAGWRLFASWAASQGSVPFALSPSGVALLLASRQGVDTFDLLSGERLAELQGFVVNREVLHIAQQADALLVQFPDEILQYDLASKNLSARLRVPGRDMCLSPDGARLAVLLNHIILLDRETGGLVAALEEEIAPAGFAFSPDSRYLAVTHMTGVHLYEARSGRLVRTLAGHGEPSAGLDFTADSQRLVSAAGDVWEIASGELVAVFDSGTEQVAVSPQGEIVVGGDGTVWRLEDGEQIGRIPFSPSRGLRMQFSADGSLLIRQTAGGLVELWAADPFAQQAAASAASPATLPLGERITALNLWRLGRVAEIGSAGAGHFAISPGWTTAAAWEGSSLTVLSLTSGQITHELTAGSQVLDAAYLGDQFLLALTSRGRVVRWDVGSGQLRQTYPFAGHRVVGSPSAGLFAVQEKYIQIVDAISGERLFNLGSAVAVQDLYPEIMRLGGGFRPGFGPDSLGQDFAFAPDGEHLAIAFGSGASLWDLRTGRSVEQFSGHGPATGGLAFTPDGSRLASLSGDVWDTASGRRLAEFEIEARSLAVSPSGELIAGSDGSLWDGNSGQYLGTLALQGSQVWFTPNSRQLVAQLAQGGVVVFGIQAKPGRGSPAGEAAAQVGLKPLTGDTAAELTLLGWWGRDPLLEARDVRDRAAPGAAHFGEQTYRDVCLTPEGPWLAALDGLGVEVVDPASGQLVDRFRHFMNPESIREIAYLGTHLLLLKGEAGVERWDLEALELVQHYDVQGEGLLASPDGTSFVLRQGNGLRLVRADSGELAGEITISPGPGSYQYSPDGSLLAVARGGTAELWDSATVQRTTILRGRGAQVHGLAFSAEGERLMAASGQIWDLGSGELLSSFDSSAGQLAVSPEGEVFLGDDGALRSVQDGARVGTVLDLRAEADQLLFRGDGRQVIWRTADGRVYTYGARILVQEPFSASSPLTAADADALTLLAHLGRGRLQEARWSPDDHYLAVNTTQNALVYQADSLRPLRSFLDARALAFDAQGGVLIGGAAPLRLLDVESGEVLREFGLRGIHAADFSPDGQTLAIAGSYGPEAHPDGLAVINLNSGLLRQLNLGRGGLGEPTALQFTPDGRTLVLSLPGSISLWEVDSGVQVRAPIRGNSGPARLSPDGRLIAYFTDRFVIERVDTGGERRTINADGTPHFPTGLDFPSLRPIGHQFNQRGNLLVFYRRLDRRSFVEDLALVEWDLAASPVRPMVRLEGLLVLSSLTGAQLETYAAEHPLRVPALGLSPRESLFYSLTGDGVIRVWDAESGRVRATSSADTMDRMAIGPGADVVILDVQGGLQVWARQSAEQIRTVEGDWQSNWLGYASRSTLGVLQPEGRLTFLDLQTGQTLDRFELSGHAGPDTFALAPDGRSFAFMTQSAGRNELQLFGLAAGGALLDLGRYPLPSRPAFSPDSRALAVAHRDQAVVWDLQTGARLLELQGVGSQVGPLAFTPDGTRLIAGSGEIWELASGTLAAQFEPSDPRLRVLSNGALIVAETGEMWDLSTGASLGVLPGVRGAALDFGFTPDGRQLLWQIGQGVTEIWGVSPESAGAP
jgi:serine/threonine-protein kinase